MRYGQIYDFYQYVVYDRERLCRGLFDIVNGLNPKNVLDCACGTGLPSLEFYEMGLNVTCTDGSEEMVNQFNRNSLRRNNSLTASVIRWIDLPKNFEKSFDCVMCRGNSLIYCDTWLEEIARIPSRDLIRENLIAIASCLSLSGYLLVDIALPSTGVVEREFPAQLIDGHSVTVRESLQTFEDYRLWTHVVEIDGVRHEYTFQSSNFTPANLVDLLTETGASQVKKVSVQGERPLYEMFLVQW